MLVALGERRRHGPLPRQTIRLAAIAGIFFTGDLMFWHHAIEAVGAGLATVLGNLQVIIVGFFAWLFLGERPSRATLLALPVVLAGVILISGVVGEDAYGSAPQLGVILGIATAICYAAYLLIIRWGGRDPRRPAGPVAVATVFVAVVRLRGRRGRRRPGPDAAAGEPVLAGDPGDHGPVGRLPADLDLAAATAGDHHLDHPADASR